MLGAIFGDIVGSIYEFKEIPKGKFLLLNPKAYFTDDTVLTIAIAEFLLTSENLSIENLSTENLTNILQRYGRKYRNCGFGANFRKWMMSSTPQPYNSWGNGSAMRVSPVGFFYSTEEEVLQVAEQTAKITHNHPEGIKGAQATALAVFLARNNKYSKKKFLNISNIVSNTIFTPHYNYRKINQKSIQNKKKRLVLLKILMLAAKKLYLWQFEPF